LEYAMAKKALGGLIADITALDRRAPRAADGPAFESALMRAGRKGDAPGIERLLAAGADPLEVRATDGMTPLMMAADRGHARCVALLLPVSDPSAVDHGGWTALMRAAAGGLSVDEAKPPQPEKPNLDGVLRWMASNRPDTRGLRLCVELLAQRCEVDARDREGWSALLLAADGQPECLQALMPISDMRARTNQGRTALMVAAAGGWDECVAALLPVSDPSATDVGGLTAAGLAQKYGRSRVAALLSRSHRNRAS
jgi:hypothetical protein